MALAAIRVFRLARQALRSGSTWEEGDDGGWGERVLILLAACGVTC